MNQRDIKCIVFLRFMFTATEKLTFTFFLSFCLSLIQDILQVGKINNTRSSSVRLKDILHIQLKSRETQHFS